MSAPNAKSQKEHYSFQAYQILRFAFMVTTIIGGLDKYFNYLTNWEQYLAPPFNVFGDPHITMMVLGLIQIIAGIGVWLKPKIFAYIIALLFLDVIINLLLLHNFYNIALTDFALLLGVLALGRLSLIYDV